MENLIKYSEYLKNNCLRNLAVEYLRIALAMDIPIIKLVKERKIIIDMEGEEGIKRTMERLHKFLTSIEDGTVYENTKKSIIQWQQDKLPYGFSKNDILPSDLILMYAAQKNAILRFLPSYCKDVSDAVSLISELESFYTRVQKDAMNTLFNIQKETEQKLKESEEKFRGFLESAPDAMVISGKDGIIRVVNTQTEKIFGYARDEMLGKKVEMLMPSRFRGEHPVHRDTYFASPKSRGMGIGLELFGKRKDGTEFPVEISLSPLKTTDGILVSAAIRDITYRKKIEDTLHQKSLELERSNKELEQFAYVASHDMQEPLRTVSSYLQLIVNRYKDKLDAEATEFIHYAVDGSNRMRELINSLLEYSRINRVKPFADSDINDVLSDVLHDMQEQIKSSGAVIKYDNLPEKLYCDNILIGRLFQNLVGNALKFHSNKKPEIIISCENKNGEYLFSVKDNGIGIQKEYWDKIFVIFQRLNNRIDFPGTGIGLSVCKKIAEKHGGRIWVTSQPGKGSVFYFTIKGNTAREASHNGREHAKQN